MNVFAPPPALGFSVGIVGHRTDRIVDPGRVRERIDHALAITQQALDRAAGGQLYEAGRHPLRLVSALAEGSDRIAAQAALDLGQVLEVVLPFPPAEYEADFTGPDEVAAFRTFLGQASAVITLDGDAAERPRAYEAAGMTLLDNCDLLIAVWDGAPGRGRGGTHEVITQAAHRAIPVVRITPDGLSIAVHAALPPRPMRFDDIPVAEITELPSIIASLVGDYGDRDEAAEWRRLAQLPPDPIITGAYPLLLKLAGLRPWFSRRAPSADKATIEAGGTLREAFLWWDNAAIRAAQNFRSAVIVNFFLAAFSVVLAATSVLGGANKWLFVVAEIITILSLLLNAMRATRLRWQERWLESRQVAELLRVCSMLRSVGIGRGIAAPGEGGSNGWYAGAIARSDPLHSVNLARPREAAAQLVEEVRDQAGWNASTARRMHSAAHRIEKFGEVLFVIVLAAAASWLVVYFNDHEEADHLKYGLTALTAGLPAISTASYGIRVILDFEGVAGRAHKISLGLSELLAWWDATPPSAVTLQEFARNAADIMLSDVAAWRLLAEGRRLTIPG